MLKVSHLLAELSTKESTKDSSSEKQEGEEENSRLLKEAQTFRKIPTNSAISLPEGLNPKEAILGPKKQEPVSWPLFDKAPTKKTSEIRPILFAQIFADFLKNNKIAILVIDSLLIFSSKYQKDLDALFYPLTKTGKSLSDLEKTNLIDQFNFEHDCFFDELILNCAQNDIKIAITHAINSDPEKLAISEAILNRAYLLPQQLKSPIIGSGVFKYEYDCESLFCEKSALEEIGKIAVNIAPKIFLWSDDLYNKITKANPENFQLFKNSNFLESIKFKEFGYFNDMMSFPALAKHLASCEEKSDAAKKDSSSLIKPLNAWAQDDKTASASEKSQKNPWPYLGYSPLESADAIYEIIDSLDDEEPFLEDSWHFESLERIISGSAMPATSPQPSGSHPISHKANQGPRNL